MPDIRHRVVVSPRSRASTRQCLQRKGSRMVDPRGRPRESSEGSRCSSSLASRSQPPSWKSLGSVRLVCEVELRRGR